MSIAASILVNLEANVARFTSNMAKATQSVEGIKKSVSTIKFAALVQLGETALRIIGRIEAFGRSVASSANELKRQAEIVGISTDEYQKLEFAAKMCDVDIGELGVGLKFLSRSMEEANKGTGDGSEIFMRLGLSITDSTGKMKPLNIMLMELADRFSEWEDGARKVDIAVGLFGRSGQNLIPLLNKGSRGIKEFYQEAERLGIVISDDIIKKGSQAEDIFKLIDAQLSAMKINTAPLILLFAKLSNNILEAANAAIKFASVQSDESKKATEGMLEAFYGGYEQFIIDPIKESTLALDEFYSGFDRLAKLPGVEAPAKIKPPEKDWIKEWVESFMPVVDAMTELGQISEVTLRAQAQNAIKNLGIVKAEFGKGATGIMDYVNALKAANEALKKLTGEDYMKERIDAQDEYEEKSKEINKEQEGWQKKQNKLIDEYFKKIKDIEKKEIPVHADVSPLENEINASIAKLEARGITLKVSSSGGQELSGIKAYGQPIENFGVSPDFFQGASDSAKNFMNDWLDIKTEMGHPVDININFTGEGSSKKPITDKIKEIIADFGGIENVLKGMEANIEFIGLSANLKQLEAQLKQIDSVMGGISTLVQWTGSQWAINSSTPANMQYAMGTILPIKAEIEKIKAQMAYSQVEAYGPSMLTGGYVPKTGSYTLHEGERVISKSVTMGNIVINTSPGTSREQAKEIAEQLALILKYKRSGNLADYIK